MTHLVIMYTLKWYTLFKVCVFKTHAGIVTIIIVIMSANEKCLSKMQLLGILSHIEGCQCYTVQPKYRVICGTVHICTALDKYLLYHSL
jgi:hypothetical protein